MPYPRPRRGRDRRVRPWVFIGASGLAAIAGYINICVLAFYHVPVSHMTGPVAHIGLGVGTGQGDDLLLTLLIVLAFIAGSIFSGALIGGITVAPGRRYGVALIAEGIVLLLATLLLLNERTAGVALAAMACGIQNAMASSYYGLTIRTTHMTGIVTDLGVMLGHLIRHRRVRLWRFFLLGTILTAFFLGGTLGAFTVQMMGAAALALAAGTCLIVGSAYFIWRDRQRRSGSTFEDQAVYTLPRRRTRAHSAR